MIQALQPHKRLIAILFLALAIVLAVYVASTSTGSSSPSTGAIPTRSSPVSIRGLVSVKVKHLRKHIWRFAYTIRNTGTAPIDGFQINALRSNLFHVTNRFGWGLYGSGICRGNHDGVLVYWSTSTSGTDAVLPKRSAKFAFSVNTRSVKQAGYSLSGGSAAPIFGKVAAPARSSMPTTGPCHS
jgi:hypothetical protein